MLHIIIFSYNRALQLDTLLTSLFEKWEAPEYCVDVIYNTSGDGYEAAYHLVQKNFSHYPVVYHRESAIADKMPLSMLLTLGNAKRLLKSPHLRCPKSNFRSLLIQIIKNNSCKHLMFLTDDAMFIQEVNISKDIFTWQDELPEHRQFILRIGTGINNQPKDIVRKENGYLKWNMYEAPLNSNWGYNFSVDAHIYHKDVILKVFDKLWFVNPNTLEDPVCRAFRRKNMMGEAMSFEHPRLLSFPINMVQTVANNESLGVDCQMLNERYLNGFTMKYPLPEFITHFQVYPNYLRMYKGNVETRLRIK